MNESDSDTEKDKITEHNYSQKRSQGSSLPREPSFSGWCDEDGVFHTDDQLENVDLIEDFHFELPLLQQGGLEKGHLDGEMNGENDKDGVPTHDVRNANGKYVAFDIENVSEREQNFSNLGENGSNSMDNHGASHSHRKSAISAIDVMKTLFFILVWYTFSTILTLYNKTLLGDDLGKFPAPLLMNTFHFAMQAVLSTAITWFWPQRFQPRVTMSWRDYFMRVWTLPFTVVPTALGTALDINLSNASLVFISVTFATMVAKETEFEFWGFIFVMLAAVMSGFRWTMTQILLQYMVKCLKNPLTLMSYVTPVMAVATAMLSLIMDPWDEFRTSNYFNSSWHITRSCLLMFLGGTLAFFMVLTEYILVSVTSAVTVTIAGVVKEAVTILVAVFYFHDQFTWLKGAGLITILFGVSLFNWYKYQKLQKGEIGEENVARSLTTNPAAKYVILEEMDDQDDGPWELGIAPDWTVQTRCYPEGVDNCHVGSVEKLVRLHRHWWWRKGSCRFRVSRQLLFNHLSTVSWSSPFIMG
ncbi:unnamed protein product [Camellia sinensis]